MVKLSDIVPEEVRGVRFSVVEEFEFECFDYTEEERNELWYNMEEMVELAKYEMQLCNENNRKEGCTWRGLEHMQTGEDERQERVAELLDRALDAFDEIFMDEMMDEDEKADLLRDACRSLTREDRKRAYKWGLRDASIADKIQEESDKKRPMKKSQSKEGGSRSSKDGQRSSKDSTRRGGKRKTSSSTRDKQRPSPSTSTSSPAAQLRMNPIAA
ncbi:expressed unknown protein [Seminavis robusta]|uniref:Uncharacterized protein n=1 Tax=Seminavis robusta TaxID=568900 RepID=A0A9N8EQR6_9STRA|nr:expressed unknown protein [Seminavis robusta]|eukprot:Sro1456_g274210.1 n/a (215) ;mRNA; r:6214-6858